MSRTKGKSTSAHPLRKDTPNPSTPIKKYEMRVMSLASLKPAPYNPRSISDEAIEGLGQSIKRFGLVEPLIFNERSGNIVGGHQRLEVLKQAGEKETTVVVVDLSDEEEKALNITLNNPNVAGDFTADLAGLLAQIKDIDSIPYEALRLDVLFKDLNLPSDDLEGVEKRSSLFLVVIECPSEPSQLELIERFTSEGLKCRAIVE